jgi:WD40 repeat protein
VVFSLDGTLMASAGQDQIVRVWRVRDGAATLTLAGHRGPVYDVAFCPGGLLASSGADGVVLLWNLQTGDQAATMIPLAAGGWAVLLPDGRHKLEGDPGDAFWWAIKLCRFGPGELDAPRDPQVIRLPVSTPLTPQNR